jgi:hypothetical protein
MHFVSNITGGVISVIAAFGAVFFAGNYASGDATIVRQLFPYTFAGWLLVLDLTVRTYSWRKNIANARNASIITRNGERPVPRQQAREVLEALFSSASGGQYFFTIPAWLLSLVVAGITALHFWPWLLQHLRGVSS